MAPLSPLVAITAAVVHPTAAHTDCRALSPFFTGDITTMQCYRPLSVLRTIIASSTNCVFLHAVRVRDPRSTRNKGRDLVTSCTVYSRNVASRIKWYCIQMPPQGEALVRCCLHVVGLHSGKPFHCNNGPLLSILLEGNAVSGDSIARKSMTVLSCVHHTSSEQFK